MFGPTKVERGRVVWPGLVVLLAGMVSMCTPPHPVSEANRDHTPGIEHLVDGQRYIEHQSSAERLIVYDIADSRSLQLLFLRSYAATPTRSGGALWADREGARVIRFDDHGVVAAVYQGAPEGEAPLTQPTYVATDGEGVIALEPSGDGVRFVEGTPTEWTRPNAEAPLSGDGLASWSGSRTILDFSLGPIRGDEPLLWASHEGEVHAIGKVTSAANAFLGHLVNTGWTAADGESRVYFASSVRPELTAYETDGTHLWTATWSPPRAVEQPTMRVENGSATPRFAVYQYGVVVGRDGLVYVLAAPDPDVGPVKILAFSEDGKLIRSGDIAERSAVFLGPKGHVFSVPTADAFSRTGEPARAEFPTFQLPSLTGDGTIDLESYRGQVVVVNFWASWCGPCRAEMPVLAEYSDRLNEGQAIVIGMNEDLTPNAGREFLDELGVVNYPNTEGGGRLRRRYNYRGLPYTVVLDGDLRVVRSFYGFGEDIDAIEETVESLLAGEPGME